MLLIHGDFTKVTIPEASVAIFDPPYGETNAEWDIAIPAGILWQRLAHIPVVVFTCKNPYAAELICENKKNFRYEMIFEKSKATGFLNAKRRPLVAHENILVFSKKTPPYYPVMGEGTPYNKGVRKSQDISDIYGRYSQAEVKSAGARYPRSVIKFRTAETEGKHHKTQKPIALMEYLVKTFSKEGETVIDPFMGSGTTGVACKNLGRSFIGIEKEKHYFEIAKERLK